MPPAVDRALALLKKLPRHAAKLLLLGILTGLLFPALAHALRPLLQPAVMGLLTLALLRVEWSALGQELRHPLPTLSIVAWLLVGSPLLMAAGVSAVALPPALAAGLVLMAASSPVLSAATLSLLFGLDATLALAAMVLATLAVPLTLPPLMAALVDVKLSVSALHIALRLGVVIGVPILLALVLRRLIGAPRLRAAAGSLDGLSLLSLLVFAIGVMDGVQAIAAASPLKVLGFTAAAFLSNLGLQAVTALGFSWLGRRRAVTAGLLAGNCNMALLLAALPQLGYADTVLFFAIGQLPIYSLPILLGPLYRRLGRGSVLAPS